MLLTKTCYLQVPTYALHPPSRATQDAAQRISVNSPYSGRSFYFRGTNSGFVNRSFYFRGTNQQLCGRKTCCQHAPPRSPSPQSSRGEASSCRPLLLLDLGNLSSHYRGTIFNSPFTIVVQGLTVHLLSCYNAQLVHLLS